MERQRWLDGTLYSPDFEQDSCGFGLIAQIDNQPSHTLVQNAIGSLVLVIFFSVIQIGGESAAREAEITSDILFVLVGLMLLGTALMLWAVVPMTSMPMPWQLWAVPAVPLLGAGVSAWVAATRREAPAFEALRAQWAQDMATLKILGEE